MWHLIHIRVLVTTALCRATRLSTTRLLPCWRRWRCRRSARRRVERARRGTPRQRAGRRARWPAERRRERGKSRKNPSKSKLVQANPSKKNFPEGFSSCKKCKLCTRGEPGGALKRPDPKMAGGWCRVSREGHSSRPHLMAMSGVKSYHIAVRHKATRPLTIRDGEETGAAAGSR